jgi:preprotein translocase subunit SecG
MLTTLASAVPLAATIVPTLGEGWHPMLVNSITVLFIVVCVFMVLTVLIQKPQGGGLAGAFGAGASSGQTAFGTKTGDALTVFTVAVFCIFLVLSIVLNLGLKIGPGPRGAQAESDPTKVIEPAPKEGPAPQLAPLPGAPEPGATTIPTTTPPDIAPPPATEPTPAPQTPAPQSPAPQPAPAGDPAPKR